MLNCDDNMWRAHIGFPDLNMDENNIYWKEWFDSYKHYILYYAELAEEFKCEMLCIGCEMLGTEHRKYEWLYLIEEIRKVYSGKLVYNTNHDHEDDVEWFDALDYIGTSAYYPVGENGVNKKSMMKEWNKIKERLNKIAEKKKKNKDIIMATFKNASTANPLFDDPDKELVYGYVDNDKYITQFSIDTDWEKALKAVK